MDTQDTTVETLEKRSKTGLTLYGALARRTFADRLVCFMPAAIPVTVTRNPRQLSRWTWQELMPKHHVLALSDPAMGIDDKILGAWYLHPTTDLLEELGILVSEQAERLGIANEKILFYGSSLGGFGALAMASLLPGSSAIAEVPQIDVAQWPSLPSIRAMESTILRMPFDQFRRIHPEMVDLRDRFKKSGIVPPFLIVSNKEDMSIGIQTVFMEEIKTLGLPSVGQQRLLLSDHVSGHTPLQPKDALFLIETWRASAESGIFESFEF